MELHPRFSGVGPPLIEKVLPSPASASRALARPADSAGRDDSILSDLVGFVAGTAVAGGLAFRAAARGQSRSQRRSLIAMQVRRRSAPAGIVKEKEVIATKRLPLWQLSDEMYLKRQLAPDPDLAWTEVRRQQAKMREQVLAQQKTDMRAMEREVAGIRLPPTLPLGEIRAGQWLEGRVSRSSERGAGVYVDVGAYTERGEWYDAFLPVAQMSEDGSFVPKEKIMDHVYLGEFIRVRVDKCVPAAGVLEVSMRKEEDLPELFMGKPRQYTVYDLEEGMKVQGIVRCVWDVWALVDIGMDRLARVHARDHKRGVDEYGFLDRMRYHRWANTAYPRGAVMDFWIRKIAHDTEVELSANRTRGKRMMNKVGEARRNGPPVMPAPEPEERMTAEQFRDREKSEKEKETWKPYVPHVDEWLEDADEPDEEADSWVARQEMEIFNEVMDERGLHRYEDEDDGLQDDDEDQTDLQKAAAQADYIEEEFDDEDDFGEDEFADDDFADDSFQIDQEEFGKEFASPASELDGWLLNDDDGDDKPGSSKGTGLSEDEIEDFFHSPNDMGAGDFSSDPRPDKPGWIEPGPLAPPR